MKEKKIGLWTYLKTFFWSGLNRRGEFQMFLAAILLFDVIAMIGGKAFPFLAAIAPYAIVGILMVVTAARNKPSLIGLMPISSRRKTVFFFLAMALYTVFVMFIVIICFMVSALIFALIILVMTGEWIMVAEETSPSEIANICPQGYVLGLIIFVCVIGMALFFGSINRQLPRRLLTLAIPAFIGIPLYLLTIIGNIKNGGLFVAFDTISYSYIYLIVFGIIGIALAILGGMRIVRLIRSKNY